MHKESVLFHEPIVSVGAAIEAYCSYQWLNQTHTPPITPVSNDASHDS